MDTQPAFGFQQLFTHIVGDMAKAICERNGETQQQQFDRSQAAVHTIMGFLPRDVIEAMLAGHCVMFHELMTDTVRHTLLGEMDTMRRATRSSIVAMDKCFGTNLTRLERYQLRPAEGRRDAPETHSAEVPMEAPAMAQAEDSVAETGRMAERAEPRAAPKQAAPVPMPPVQTPNIPAEPQPESSAPPVAETTLIFTPSPEAIAACRANPEAMAALDAGDPERFARAMGILQPSEAYLAAAAGQGGTFNRQALDTRPPESITSRQAHRSDGIASGDGRIVGAARDATGNSTSR